MQKRGKKLRAQKSIEHNIGKCSCDVPTDCKRIFFARNEEKTRQSLHEHANIINERHHIAWPKRELLHITGMINTMMHSGVFIVVLVILTRKSMRWVRHQHQNEHNHQLRRHCGVLSPPATINCQLGICNQVKTKTFQTLSAKIGENRAFAPCD